MPAKKKQPPVIKLKSLKKRYGLGDAEHFALNGINLTIKKGEFVAIMGPSGCGKTTLLNILGLLDQPSEGTYELDGAPVDTLSPSKQAHIRSRDIGFIFQSFNLIPRLTVLENVALPLTYKGVRKVKRLSLASTMLKTFHLGEREYYMPWQLSGGQSQRVAIARSLVNQPRLILADSPLEGLDDQAQEEFLYICTKLSQVGYPIVMTSSYMHPFEIAALRCVELAGEKK